VRLPIVRGSWLPEELRPLRGWAWAPFLALCLIVLGFSAYGSILYLGDIDLKPKPEARYGLIMRDPLNTGIAGDGAVVRLPLGRETATFDVQPGDRVVAINGRPLGPTDLPVRARVKELDLPPAIDVTMVKPNGRRSVLHLTRSDAHVAEGFAPSGLSYSRMKGTGAAITLVAWLLVPSGLAVLLLLRRPGDPLAPWLALSLLLIPLAGGPAQIASLQRDAAGPLGWAVTIAMPFVAWLGNAVLALFPDARFKPRWTWAVVLGSVALSFFVRIDSPTYQANFANLIGLFAAVAVVAVRYKTMPRGTEGQQIRWVLLGFGASLVALFLQVLAEHTLAFADNVLIYTWTYLADIVLGSLANAFLFAAMTLGLLRYRLYDADAAISRSVTYGAITLGLLAVFAGSEKVIEVLGEEYLGHSLGAFAAGLGAAMAAVCVVPLHHRVTHWAEKRFQGGLAHLRSGLPILVGEMRETATPAELADVMLVRVEKGVRAVHGAVVTGGKILDVRDIDSATVAAWLKRGDAPANALRQLQIDRADPVFPMRVPLYAETCGLVGWLLLGPRPDGSFYGREERSALKEIAYPIARGLAIALERERREAESSARIRAMQTSIAELRESLNVMRSAMDERLGVGTER